ncbi:hypothetical protein [Ktedonospora formicarum]|uniref:Uncharacterized protein n=1 Tax=Ktedonospora formicarum TaxID=2778364 RepID=A0A8J3I9F8_9CHLR|nr:hypothetical protein [Ktedonospora formicarum]GHO47914.1 hypothetical protein KSX_60770 [Ktedonospora formicarum]
MAKQTTQPQTKRQRQHGRREEQRRNRERQQREQRNRWYIIGGTILVAVLIIAGIVYGVTRNNQNQASNNSSTSSTNNASTTNPAYAAVNGITCDAQEQLNYHIHAHLSVYIDGQPVAIPQNIGIASDGSCIYWLHTHDTTGLLHIESPTTKTYTLGDFFTVWQQRFSSLGYPAQLKQNTGWKIYVDGKEYTGDFHDIKLGAHSLITMGYNSPNMQPDTTYNWGDN